MVEQPIPTVGCTASMRNRVLNVVAAFFAGAAIAALATVVHAQLFPMVLVGAFVTVASYLGALRLLSDDRLVVASGAIAVVVTVLIFAQRSSGGSVLIQADAAGNMWVFGSAIIAGLAATWPQIRSRSDD